MQSVCEQPKKLFSATKDLGNPFQEESKDLLALDTKIFAHPSAVEVVKTHIDKGQAAFKDFFNSVGDEASFYKPIKKNKTDFFHQQAAVSSTDKKKQLLKSDCNLLSQLFISCQARECDLPEFFRHENQSCQLFEEYAARDVVPKTRSYSSKYERTDIVFDVYKHAYGASQQNVQCNLKVLATGAGKEKVKPGKFSGQTSHPLLSPACS